uniref:Uncharacterized protein n=1 Tax=Cyanoptyche gloeocystis TaxID=77922 RepID=A0A7S2NQP0_9EUKA|eukprot:CAMPEP_0196660684 /NCGR_PEP_ID=MMETSP1086-20130531/40836_1 /TAXON_ID=77921 /ORGANISM="Cyanoptyche  gloeocystis , Strain SAG4.97" /LENGTH=151 /DNA_ID=CAMNT_0041995229 /DNA_START=92 /DNA_END=547 /DNA_ORIENTATION=+
MQQSQQSRQAFQISFFGERSLPSTSHFRTIESRATCPRAPLGKSPVTVASQQPENSAEPSRKEPQKFFSHIWCWPKQGYLRFRPEEDYSELWLEGWESHSGSLSDAISGTTGPCSDITRRPFSKHVLADGRRSLGYEDLAAWECREPTPED